MRTAARPASARGTRAGGSTGPTTGERQGDQVRRLDRLYTAVVADVLDRLGYRNQTLHPAVRALFPGARLAGFALTVQTVPAREVAPAEPYKGELAAVDALG